MAELNHDDWDYFWNNVWGRVIKAVPSIRKDVLREMGAAIKRDVDDQILRQGVNDRFGRVRRWQQEKVGSGGGYVKVSPENEDIRISAGGNKTTSRKVTGLLEHGHGVRKPSGRNKRYVPRIRGNGRYVRGFQFYSWAAMDAEKHAMTAGGRILSRLEVLLEDQGVLSIEEDEE